jgi:hypothetical protein
MDIVKREPVLSVGLITTAIVAVLTLTDVFGLTSTTPEQRAAITACVVALWPILLVCRQLVTPAAAPRLPVGSELNGGTAVVAPK